MKRKSIAAIEIKEHETNITNCIIIHCTDRQIERVKRAICAALKHRPARRAKR